MTSYATQSAYCFRTTNSGAVLDNYTKVAELKMLHVPFFTNWAFNGGSHIALTEGTTTQIMATGTVTDYNGYTDLINATTTDFRSSVANGRYCSADANQCYQIATTSCSFSNCSGNICTVSCSAALYYFADPAESHQSGKVARLERGIADYNHALAMHCPAKPFQKFRDERGMRDQ